MRISYGKWPEYNEKGVLDMLGRVKADLGKLNPQYKKFTLKQILEVVNSRSETGYPIISGRGGISYDLNVSEIRHFLNNYHYSSKGCANCVSQNDDNLNKRYCEVHEANKKDNLQFTPSGLSSKLNENYGKGCEQREIKKGLRSVEEMFKE
jgi:hypothetical protein